MVPVALTDDRWEWCVPAPVVSWRARGGADQSVAPELSSWSDHQWSWSSNTTASRSSTEVAGKNAPRVPFIQPMVFPSDPTLHVALAADARTHVYGPDGSPVVTSGALPGIVDAVTGIGALEANSTRFRKLNTPTTRHQRDPDLRDRDAAPPPRRPFTGA